MATELLPLNKFRLVTKKLVSGSFENVYEVPETATGVVLSCQISNNTNEEQSVNVKTERGPSGSQVLDGEVAEGAEFTLVSEGIIPPNDVFNPLTGRLILEETDSILINGSSNEIEINLSVLETANE